MRHIQVIALKVYGRAVLGLAACVLLLAPAVHAQHNGEDGHTRLGAVFVCDSIVSGRPLGRSVVFSADQGTLFCYSSFAAVAESGQITHRWLFRDREIAQFRLTIQPPRWASYSSLKIPPDSRGPWRVEVLDQNGELYGTARFSIVD